jgi:hypothetical protein
MKVFCTAFMCLQFGFVIFWQKDFCTKAAHKMLVQQSFTALPLAKMPASANVIALTLTPLE